MDAFVDLRRDVLTLGMELQRCIPWASGEGRADSAHASQQIGIRRNQHTWTNTRGRAYEIVSRVLEMPSPPAMPPNVDVAAAMSLLLLLMDRDARSVSCHESERKRRSGLPRQAGRFFLMVSGRARA